VGVTADEFDKQTDTLLQIAQGAIRSQSLMPTETRVWRGAYSKDYYEPVMDQVTSLIPTWARNVLSIGCGSGATERWLAEKGLRVAAIPLDPVIAANAAANGVTIYDRAELSGEEHFDCILCLNILHLAPKPQELLSLSHGLMHQRSTLVVQTPNMMSLRALRHGLKIGTHLNGFSDFESTEMVRQCGIQDRRNAANPRTPWRRKAWRGVGLWQLSAQNSLTTPRDVHSYDSH
jgi:2-polyprenyl-3-methyl-5-hydroxy-6-metoxy-1,4-benzoquinol methylase